RPLMIVGIIGGSGITAALLDSAVETREVETAHGPVAATLGTIDGKPVAFLPRHGIDHTLLPHQVNYRANALALHALRITRVLATSACGSLCADLPPGSLTLLTDFIDFTRARPWTLSACGSGATAFHVDMSDPYCSVLRGAVTAAAEELSIAL